MIVLDASAVVEWLLGRPLAAAVERRLTHGSPSLHAPHLLAVEVAQVIRRYHVQGVLSAERGSLALTAWQTSISRRTRMNPCCRASGSCGRA